MQGKWASRKSVISDFVKGVAEHGSQTVGGGGSG